MVIKAFETFQQKSVDFETSLDKDQKKNQGIYYTDVNLAFKIIEFLKLDKKKSFYDPNCGSGSFVYAAQEYGFKKIYGADINRKAITLCRKLTDLKANQVKCLDTIGLTSKDVLRKFKVKEKFDYIMGNPPYVPIDKNIVIDTNDYLFLRNIRDSGNNLFIASLYRALEAINEDGIVSFIIPKNFLHIASYALLRKKILNELTIHSIIDIGSYFKGVRGEQIVLSLVKRPPENNYIIHCKLDDNIKIRPVSEIKQDFYSNELLFFDSQRDFELYEKLSKTYQSFQDICTGYVGRGKSRDKSAISGKEIRKFGLKNYEVPQKGNQIFIQNIYSAEAGIIAAFAGTLRASETVTVFTDGDEKMCRYILGLLHTRLCNYYLLKFCFNNSKLTMHTDAKYLKKIPLVKERKTFNQVVNIVKQLEKIDYMSS